MRQAPQTPLRPFPVGILAVQHQALLQPVPALGVVAPADRGAPNDVVRVGHATRVTYAPGKCHGLRPEGCGSRVIAPFERYEPEAVEVVVLMRRQAIALAYAEPLLEQPPRPCQVAHAQRDDCLPKQPTDDRRWIPQPPRDG